MLFGGTIPHYFYALVERMFPEEVVAFPLAKKLIFERCIFAPLMQAFSLYTLARFEGKNHNAAMKQLFALYWPVLQANWKWLTLFQVINLALVPPMVSKSLLVHSIKRSCLSHLYRSSKLHRFLLIFTIF